MGDKRVRAFRRWRDKAGAAPPSTGGAVDEPVPEPVGAGPAIGPVLATPLPQRRRVASGERTAPVEGSDVRDLAAMMDFLRRET